MGLGTKKSSWIQRRVKLVRFKLTLLGLTFLIYNCWDKNFIIFDLYFELNSCYTKDGLEDYDSDSSFLNKILLAFLVWIKIETNFECPSPE